jgi:hypothetical protein
MAVSRESTNNCFSLRGQLYLRVSCLIIDNSPLGVCVDVAPAPASLLCSLNALVCGGQVSTLTVLALSGIICGSSAQDFLAGQLTHCDSEIFIF